VLLYNILFLHAIVLHIQSLTLVYMVTILVTSVRVPTPTQYDVIHFWHIIYCVRHVPVPHTFRLTKIPRNRLVIVHTQMHVKYKKIPF
jgi:hypothetical protein